MRLDSAIRQRCRQRSGRRSNQAQRSDLQHAARGCRRGVRSRDRSTVCPGAANGGTGCPGFGKAAGTHCSRRRHTSRWDELLSKSDFLTLHTPLVDGTHHLIDEGALRLMKPHAILINTSRGGVIDEAALIRALQEGWIGGAGLDVFEHEPVSPDSPPADK